MADIKYTPEQLLAQSAEMSSLQSEYTALFAQVTNALNNMNDSWSENLSRNFSAKIQSAQKSFSSIANMLDNGANAAKLGATSHSPTSIETFMSMLWDADGKIAGIFQENETTTILTEEEKQWFMNAVPENLRKDIESAQDVDQWLAENYEKIPEEIREQVEDLLPGGIKNGISVSRDILNGEVDASTIGKAVTEVTGDSLKGKTTVALFEAAFNKRLEKFDRDSDFSYEKAANSFQAGDIADGLMYTLEGMGYQYRKGFYVAGDTALNFAGAALQGTKLPVISGIGTAMKNML